MIKEYPACPFCMNAPRYLAFQEGFHAEAVICDTCKFSLPPDTWCNRVEQYVHAGYVSVSALECLAEVTNENMASSIRLYNRVDLPRCITTEVFLRKQKE
jgi:hypothetical protein